MRNGRRLTAAHVLAASFLVAMLSGAAEGQGPPAGQLTIAFDISLTPSFLEPADTSGIGTPFVFLYA